MLYGYCLRLVGDPPPTEGLTGIDGAPVRAYRFDNVTVWLSDVDQSVEVSEERLRQHERVVRDALATATPLPLRFGSVFRSSEALEDAIAARGEAFLATLYRVAGHAEMVIRIEGSPDVQAEPHTGGRSPAVAAPPSSGREYLERRRAEFETRERGRLAAERLLREVEREVTDLATATAVSTDRDGRFAGRVACLVRRGDLSAFRHQVSRIIQEGRPELRIQVTGPWAPYSFADE